MSKPKNTKELIETLKIRLAETIKADATLGSDIDKLHALLADATTPPTAPTAPQVYTTADGVSIYVTGVDTDGIIDVGLPAFSDAAGTIPMADGTYTLADGTSVTIVGGLVTDVATTVPATPPAVAPDPAMMATMEAQKKEIATLKTNLEMANTKQSELVALFKRILDTPVDVKQSAQKKDVAELEKMNPLEYRRYLRSLENKK